MHSNLKAKLRSRVGESIAESLVSILVVAVASIMFAGMVTASRNIIDTSSKWMKDYYQAVSDVNEKNSSRSGGTAKVTVGSTSISEEVEIYSFEAGGIKIVSYVLTTP